MVCIWHAAVKTTRLTNKCCIFSPKQTPAAVHQQDQTLTTITTLCSSEKKNSLKQRQKRNAQKTHRTILPPRKVTLIRFFFENTSVYTKNVYSLMNFFAKLQKQTNKSNNPFKKLPATLSNFNSKFGVPIQNMETRRSSSESTNWRIKAKSAKKSGKTKARYLFRLN